MANPNPELWGSPETWIYCKSNPNALSTALSRTLHCEKPKITNFGGTDNDYVGSLGRGVSQEHIPFNVPLDATICPCGQDANVSAYGSYAIINEDNNHSTTPTSIVKRTSPINWFFCDKPGGGSNFETITKRYSSGSSDRMSREQYSPHASDDDASTFANSNFNAYIVPYTYYGIKTFVLSIIVNTITGYNNIGAPQTSWAYLDTWRDTYPERKICGAAFYVRPAMSINASTLDITYMTGMTVSEGSSVGQVSVLENFNVTNDGQANTETDFYAMHLSSTSTVRRAGILFNITNPVSYRSEAQGSSIGVMPAYDMFEDQVIKQYQGLSYEHNYFYEIPYSDSNYETIMKMVACFGCYFTPSNKYVFNNDMTDSDICLPIIDGDGIAHGEYTRGTGNRNNDLYDADSIRDKNYDPSKPPTPIDPNTYSNVTNFNLVTESASMTRRYVLNAANVEKLGDDLWTICQDIATGGDFEYFDGKLKNEFLTTNPIDSIISLMRFPFNIPYQLQPLQSYVKLGRSEGSAKGWVTVFISNQINFTGVDIFPRFGNSFLDYEPFTTYELYIPFCGTTKIRAADILGHTLNVSMIIDLITGSCTAYIKADQLVIETVNGSCGISQQISGIDTTTMNANIYNGILNQKQAKTQYIAQAAGALMPSNWVNPVGYAAKGEQAETSYKAATYAIEHMETPVHNIGSASPLLGWIQEFDARLLIYYPEGDVIENTIPPSFKAVPLAAFGHLKGYATATPGSVSNFQMRGKAAYLSGDIIPDSISCTLSERNRIKAMFADGVYLPPL